MTQKQESIPETTAFSDKTTAALLTACYTAAFAVPFFLAGPQIITGTIVNALLFFAAFYLPKNRIIPLIFIPGIATLSRGLLFGPATPFLIYFLPFIWGGNYILTQSSREVFARTKNPFWTVILSAGLKFLFLAFFARTFFYFKIVPALFTVSMGVLQFMTAVFGGIIIFGGIYLSRGKIRS